MPVVVQEGMAVRIVVLGVAVVIKRTHLTV